MLGIPETHGQLGFHRVGSEQARLVCPQGDGSKPFPPRSFWQVFFPFLFVAPPPRGVLRTRLWCLGELHEQSPGPVVLHTAASVCPGLGSTGRGFASLENGSSRGSLHQPQHSTASQRSRVFRMPYPDLLSQRPSLPMILMQLQFENWPRIFFDGI